MCILSSNTACRLLNGGSDRMGRFCWYTVEGKYDEGIICTTVYRVCKESNPEPLTAHQNCYMTLRQEGKTKPNAMKDILQEPTDLIQKKRQEGYQPVLMMDANGDYT